MSLYVLDMIATTCLVIHHSPAAGVIEIKTLVEVHHLVVISGLAVSRRDNVIAVIHPVVAIVTLVNETMVVATLAIRNLSDDSVLVIDHHRILHIRHTVIVRLIALILIRVIPLDRNHHLLVLVDPRCVEGMIGTSVLVVLSLIHI